MISPASPSGTSRPLSSAIFTSTSGTALPMLAILASACWGSGMGIRGEIGRAACSSDLRLPFGNLAASLVGDFSLHIGNSPADACHLGVGLLGLGNGNQRRDRKSGVLFRSPPPLREPRGLSRRRFFPPHREQPCRCLPSWRRLVGAR